MQRKNRWSTPAQSSLSPPNDIRRSGSPGGQPTPTDNIELSLVGQNLFESGREEFAPEFLSMTATQNERGVYGELTLIF